MKTKNFLDYLILAAGLIWFVPHRSLQAELIHRYSFTTDVVDLVGSASGELKGIATVFDGNGQLVVPGGGSSADPLESLLGYVDLPNHLINGLTNLTLETWVTWQGDGVEEHIFDFGTSAEGEDHSSGKGSSLFLSPQSETNLRFVVRDSTTGTDVVQLTGPAPLQAGAEVCLTVTYDYSANISRLYSNAVLLATGPAPLALNAIDDVNNWLGRSQGADPMFAGSYNEFRIYDAALDSVEVAASYASGSADPSTDPTALGDVQGVHLIMAKAALNEGEQLSAAASVDYMTMTGISLAGVSGVSFESDNPNVASISSEGTIVAVGPGTANLSVSFSGKSDAVAFTVIRKPDAGAVAGTLYIDLRAADLTNNPAAWPNNAGTGDFTAVGSPRFDPDVGGSGIAGVDLNGTSDAFVGPPSTEDLEGNSDRSVEIWVFDATPGAEETVVAWGQGGGTIPSNNVLNFGSDPNSGAIDLGNDGLGWKGNPAAGAWHYLVYTYDGTNTLRVYLDGQLNNVREVGGGLMTATNLPIRVGAPGNAEGSDFNFGQAFSGSLARVRVEGGLLTDNDIKTNFLLGVELTDPGVLSGITLSLGSTMLTGSGEPTVARVTADYANRKYLNVTGFSTFESSDTNVVTVDSSGRIVSVLPGSAAIIATYLEQHATQTVSVARAAPPELRHRYRFDEASGSTTVKDSVGTADGTLKGDLGLGGGFSGGGKLALPGGAAGSGAPYVDLPNGIISMLTNATFEAWVTWRGAGPAEDTWQRVFDFGDNSAGEDAQGIGQTYLFLTPRGGPGFMQFAASIQSDREEMPVLDGPVALGIGESAYVVVTYDTRAEIARLFLNGQQVASGSAPSALAEFKDVNVWLGRSNWEDPYFFGELDEFRIWEGAMEAEQIAANYQSGPNGLPSDPPPPAPSLDITFSPEAVVISWPAEATGYVLQSSPAMGSSWSAVETVPANEGGRSIVPVNPTEGTQFYRLEKQP